MAQMALLVVSTVFGADVRWSVVVCPLAVLGTAGAQDRALVGRVDPALEESTSFELEALMG